METFRERLIEAMAVRNMTQAELADKSNLSRASLTYYVNGKWTAKQGTIVKLAMALNVSPSWLMGEDCSMEVQKNKIEDITDAEKRLISYYRKLNTLGKSKAISNMFDMTKIDDFTDND